MLYSNYKGGRYMNISVFNKTIDMVARIFDPRKSTQPMIEYKRNKPVADTSAIKQSFERVSPESQGVPSALIAGFLKKLCDDEGLDMHSIIILRNGKIISQTSFGIQDPAVWKMTYSAAKTVTALAIGLLVDRGLISVSDKVSKFFPEKLAPLSKITLKDLTVEDLLAMRSGLVFNEAGSLVEKDWQKGFLNSVVNGKVGETFNYNSLNSYLLSSIVVAVTKTTLTEFLRKTLFEPMEIENFYWETCPMGIEKGGWGLYIHPEDMAKIGQLVMNKGLWQGKRLISESWIEDMTSLHSITPDICGDYNYGYHIWVGRKSNTYLFNGMFGQNVLGFWDNGIVIVSNAGNDEVFQSSSYYRIAEELFGGKFEEALPENKVALSALRKTEKDCSFTRTQRRERRLLSFFHKKDAFSQAKSFLSGSVLAPKEPCPSVGFMPATLQVTQNNFTKGISRIAFSYNGDGLLMTFVEGDSEYSVPVGFEKAEVCDILFDGEPFRVSVLGRFATDEEDNYVLTVNVAFVETPFSRKIKMRFLVSSEYKKVNIEIKEQPGEAYLVQFAEKYLETLDNVPLLSNVIAKADMGFLKFMVSRVMEPVVEAVKVENLPLSAESNENTQGEE